MADNNRKFLIFSLQGSFYAIDLAQVAEVSDPPQMWPIPRAPSYYSGALNFHGDIVAVMNLSDFLGITGCSQPRKLIILHHDLASLAFLVDSVVKIVNEQEDISFSPATDNSLISSIMNLSDGSKVSQIDHEAIVLSAGISMQSNQTKSTFYSQHKK